MIPKFIFDNLIDAHTVHFESLQPLRGHQLMLVAKPTAAHTA